MHMGDYQGFGVQRLDQGVVLATFNRPERMNGMNGGMKRDLVEFLLQAQLDDAVRVVVFTGEGRAFCAGDDLSGGYTDPALAPTKVPAAPPGHHDALGTYDALRHISQAVNRAVRDLDKLSIAAVNGFAIQTGFSLALACDFRLAARDARLGSATLRFGLLPDEGGQWLLVQHLGVAATMDFLMRKRIVSAEDAHSLGLVHEVCEPEDLLPRALELAAELAAGPQVAMRLLKRSIYSAAELSFAQACDEIAAKTAISDHHPDAVEGGRAFREKRSPRFL
jgi:2-(1,2-epoxy-1,2-dihydrophenyl)acetyl-CoA isomerase